MSKKTDLENTIFHGASKFLKGLYGNFTRIEEQIDKPDAAIKLNESNDNIGIEITTVDKQEDLAYFNDTKSAAKYIEKSIDDCTNKVIPTQPIKKKSIPRKNDFLIEGIEAKREKYNSYLSSGKFNEIILLVFSDYINKYDEFFLDYHVPWTNYILSREDYPFSKVIFVCTSSQECTLLYDKKNKLLIKPKRDQKKELGYTPIISGFIPVGKKVNLLDIARNEALVKPRVRQNRKSKKES